jgi:hypothetical protein
MKQDLKGLIKESHFGTLGKSGTKGKSRVLGSAGKLKNPRCTEGSTSDECDLVPDTGFDGNASASYIDLEEFGTIPAAKAAKNRKMLDKKLASTHHDDRRTLASLQQYHKACPNGYFPLCSKDTHGNCEFHYTHAEAMTWCESIVSFVQFIILSILTICIL